MEQILEKKLGTLNASYLERAIEEVLPSRIITMGVFMLDVKMERSTKDYEVNVAY
jgi:hypothetical protein